MSLLKTGQGAESSVTSSHDETRLTNSDHSGIFESLEDVGKGGVVLLIVLSNPSTCTLLIALQIRLMLTLLVRVANFHHNTGGDDILLRSLSLVTPRADANRLRPLLINQKGPYKILLFLS